MKNNWRLDILLLALDNYDLNEMVELLKDGGGFFDKYCFEEPDGYFSVETARFGSIEDVLLMLKFIFGNDRKPQELFRSGETVIFDLTAILSEIKNPDTDYPATGVLDNWYRDWIKESGRENSMNEYGQLIGVIGYIQRHQNKNYCLLIIQPVVN